MVNNKVRCSNYKRCFMKNSCPHAGIHEYMKSCDMTCMYHDDDNSNCEEIDEYICMSFKKNRSKENKMIIQYIKDKKGKKGCLIGLSNVPGEYSIGWSKFNRSEEIGKFDKEKAKEIAIGRALNNTDMFNCFYSGNTSDGIKIANFPASFANDINDFMERCDRYFHTDKGPANFNWEK